MKKLNNFLIGIGSAFNIAGNYFTTPYEKSMEIYKRTDLNGPEKDKLILGSDMKKLEQDWKTIEKDLGCLVEKNE